MAKTFYIGVDGKARKCKKAYIGINGIARKIKKMYIGVAGIARCFFGGAELTYYGTTAENLTGVEYGTHVVGASVGNYAVFADGGAANGTYTANAYDSSLTHSSMNLGYRLTRGAGASTDDYAIFNGTYFANDPYNFIALNSSLTVTAFNVDGQFSNRIMLAGASNSYAAIFAGGATSTDSYTKQSGLECIDNSLTRLRVGGGWGNLSVARSGLHGVSTENYAAFGAGEGNNPSSDNSRITVDIFDNSLTRTSTQYSTARIYSAGATTNDYILFGGGNTNGAFSDVVDAYDNGLTRVSANSLSVARQELKGGSINGYAVFAGGGNGNGDSDVVDVYDSSLTRVKTFSLSKARRNSGSATVGNFLLFAGGGFSSSSSGVCNMVDAFMID